MPLHQWQQQPLITCFRKIFRSVPCLRFTYNENSKHKTSGVELEQGVAIEWVLLQGYFRIPGLKQNRMCLRLLQRTSLVELKKTSIKLETNSMSVIMQIDKRRREKFPRLNIGVCLPISRISTWWKEERIGGASHRRIN
ncbi:hypothetical protein CEXT_179981 [Caerostris extrusa]|uniref:Uncharacterized protein n=1 Tax=Caerostris extrusa TaxID=172846 RepID=A0AAV4QCE3_CAEEX|nr:hypothetical protein CEXT_179981 [Caerostris extrusa]